MNMLIEGVKLQLLGKPITIQKWLYAIQRTYAKEFEFKFYSEYISDGIIVILGKFI